METATWEKFWKELMVPTFLTLNPFKYVSTGKVICLQGRIKWIQDNHHCDTKYWKQAVLAVCKYSPGKRSKPRTIQEAEESHDVACGLYQTLRNYKTTEHNRYQCRNSNQVAHEQVCICSTLGHTSLLGTLPQRIFSFISVPACSSFVFNDTTSPSHEHCVHTN